MEICKDFYSLLEERYERKISIGLCQIVKYLFTAEISCILTGTPQEGGSATRRAGANVAARVGKEIPGSCAKSKDLSTSAHACNLCQGLGLTSVCTQVCVWVHTTSASTLRDAEVPSEAERGTDLLRGVAPSLYS